MSEPNYVRQQDFMPQKLWHDVDVHVVGAGGIGSCTAIALAKVGCKSFILYDDDTVEPHNSPNQMLGANMESHGKYKIDDLASLMLDLGGNDIEIKRCHRRVTAEDPVEIVDHKKSIVIVGPDNMECRAQCFEALKTVLADDEKFIMGYFDGRMASRCFILYTLHSGDVIEDQLEAYAKTLHSSADSQETPCTDKATFQTNLILSSVICENVRRILVNDALGDEPELKIIHPKMHVSPVTFEIIFDLLQLQFMKRSVEQYMGVA